MKKFQRVKNLKEYLNNLTDQDNLDIDDFLYNYIISCVPENQFLHIKEKIDYINNSMMKDFLISREITYENISYIKEYIQGNISDDKLSNIIHFADIIKMRNRDEDEEENKVDAETL